MSHFSLMIRSPHLSSHGAFTELPTKWWKWIPKIMGIFRWACAVDVPSPVLRRHFNSDLDFSWGLWDWDTYIYVKLCVSVVELEGFSFQSRGYLSEAASDTHSSHGRLYTNIPCKCLAPGRSSWPHNNHPRRPHPFLMASFSPMASILTLLSLRTIPPSDTSSTISCFESVTPRYPSPSTST